MKIGCVCPTYKRPQFLGRAIHCFLQQMYSDAYLVVLDDAGQYESKEHERWRLVSTETRYPSLGAKRQAGINMLPSDCEGYLCWDDDDVYFPHAVAAVAEALQERPWAQCRVVLENVKPGVLAVTEACRRVSHRPIQIRPGITKEGSVVITWGYGGCWAYRLDSLTQLGGYNKAPSTNDDLELAYNFYLRYGSSADSTPAQKPWYWYNRDPGVNKVCDEGKGFWEIRGALPFRRMREPPIGWNGPDIYGYQVLPGVRPRPF